MEIRKTLSLLCAAQGPSGFEQNAAKCAASFLAPLVDEMQTDWMGNLIGILRSGKKNAKRVLLDAHLDEIGLIITGWKNGFLRFQTIGGVDPRMLPARELSILTSPPIFGVVACLPPHVQKGRDHDRSIPIDELYIDIGMSEAEAKRSVPVGTPAVFRGGCFPLGEQQICGKSLDDRACFTALLRTAELLKGKPLPVDLYIMGSTREEVSGAGAAAGAFRLDPYCCVAVDVTHGQTPDAPRDKTLAVGGGAAIGLGPNMTPWMSRRMLELARTRGIPHQLEVMEGNTGTNGWKMQIVREGIPTMVVSLPLKYMHSPVETLSLDDLESVAALLAAFVESLGEGGALNA